MDRAGKVLSTLGPVAGYITPALSPDTRTLAVSRTGENSLNVSDIWLFDVARNVPTRFTFGGNNQDPVWTPDGKQVVFFSAPTSAAPAGIYQKPADGSSQERLAFRRDTYARPTGFSPDGKYLLAELPISGLIVIPWPPPSPDAKSTPYFESTASVRHGQFSPDGKWVAYASNEGNSGRYDIYVQSFPAGKGKYQISTGGGMQPRWRRDGRELYFVNPTGVLCSVDIQPGAHLEIGIPRQLYNSGIWTSAVTGTEYRYDVAPDGNRFLINPFGQVSNVVPPITVVLNWNAR